MEQIIEIGLDFGQFSTTLVPTTWEEFFRRFDAGQMTFHYNPDADSRRYRIEWPSEGEEDEDW